MNKQTEYLEASMKSLGFPTLREMLEQHDCHKGEESGCMCEDEEYLWHIDQHERKQQVSPNCIYCIEKAD